MVHCQYKKFKYKKYLSNKNIYFEILINWALGIGHWVVNLPITPSPHPHRGRFLILSVKGGPGRHGGKVYKEDLIRTMVFWRTVLVTKRIWFCTVFLPCLLSFQVIQVLSSRQFKIPTLVRSPHLPLPYSLLYCHLSPVTCHLLHKLWNSKKISEGDR